MSGLVECPAAVVLALFAQSSLFILSWPHVQMQVGKETTDPYPALQPKDSEGVVLAEFDLDEIAEARHR